MKKIALISALLVAVLFYTCSLAYAGGRVMYTVKPGDTLYGIGKKTGIDYRLIMKENGLNNPLILPGDRLVMPGNGNNLHTVKAGENLYRIARYYGVRFSDIREASNLKGTVIYPGMVLNIPDSDPEVKNQISIKPVFSGIPTLSKTDIQLLAKLIHAEARGESLEGQIAVGAVIINRLKSAEFPRTVKEVIFQKTKGVYQFTPVQDGQINLDPNKSAFYAAEKAIQGEDPTEGAIFFYNPDTSTDQWIKTLPVTKVIGNHVFAK